MTTNQNWEVQIRTGQHTWSVVTIDAPSPDEAADIAVRLIPGRVVSVA